MAAQPVPIEQDEDDEIVEPSRAELYRAVHVCLIAKTLVEEFIENGKLPASTFMKLVHELSEYSDYLECNGIAGSDNFKDETGSIYTRFQQTCAWPE